MNNIVAVSVLLLLSSAPAFAQAGKPDPKKLLYDLGQSIDQAFRRDPSTKLWSVTENNGSVCKTLLDELAQAGVPGSAKLTLSNDTPETVAGEYSVDDVRGICKKVVYYAEIQGWEKWAIQALKESSRIGGNQYYDTVYFERCVEKYKALIEAGIPSSQKVLERDVEDAEGKTVRWAGTILDLRKKWCDIGLKTVSAEIAKREAPYRKVLKADKLTMALQTGTFYVAGGAVTSDPKKLAAAAVWFSDTQSVNSTRDVCTSGDEIHTVHRYQFNAKHKLVKTTDKQYCGRVPKSAFK